MDDRRHEHPATPDRRVGGRASPDPLRNTPAASAPSRESAEAAAFAADLARRAVAAKGLQTDLLTQVPLLYGSPDAHAPGGDPGTVLARLHREDLLRRNGGGVPSFRPNREPPRLPYERALLVLGVILGVVLALAR